MLIKSLALLMAIGALALLVFATKGQSTNANVSVGFSNENVIFIAKDNPSNVGAESVLLESLPRVESWDELRSSTTAQTNVIIIDESALNEAPTLFLEQQVGQGISLIGINVPLAELRRISNFDEVVHQNAIDSEKGPKLADPAPAPSEPYYSYVRMNPADSEIRRVSQGQKKVSSGVFKADLNRTASSRLSSSEPP
jgi:hypothetical protein